MNTLKWNIAEYPYKTTTERSIYSRIQLDKMQMDRNTLCENVIPVDGNKFDSDDN